VRAFIVGNGPSLNDTPLELLEGEVCYGVNAVHFIYGETSWRPNHIVIGDVDRPHSAWWWEIYSKEKPWHVDERVNRFLGIVDANDAAQIHIRGVYAWAEMLLGERANVDYFSTCTHHALKGASTWHFPQICKYGGTLLMAVQLAVQEGYSPLYMVGCDLGYKEGRGNHFTENYDPEFINQEKADIINEIKENAHELADEQWEIYNAGVGGSLEAHRRVELKELFDD
jgi:hypothetical protein